MKQYCCALILLLCSELFGVGIVLAQEEDKEWQEEYGFEEFPQEKRKMERLLFSLRGGVYSDFPFDFPKVRSVSPFWIEKAASYQNIQDIEKEIHGQPFERGMDVLAGLNAFAWRRYKASLRFGRIELEDILQHEKHYTSVNISAVMAKLAHDLGYESATAMTLGRKSGIVEGVTLVSESKGSPFSILDRDRVIDSRTKDIEQALEQWSVYTGRAYWVTNLYGANGKTLYVGLNELGERIRPSHMPFPKDSLSHFEMLLHNHEISAAYFFRSFGIQAGAMQGYGPLEWSPFVRVAASKKFMEPENSVRFYLDTSYMRGGGGIFFFRQQDREGEKKNRIGIITELGTEFSVTPLEEIGLDIVLGGNYLNDWGAYLDIAKNKFKNETIPYSFLELKAGVRKHFSLGNLSLHLTPYALGRYTSYDVQSPIPFVYGIYGIRGCFFYPLTDSSHILLDACVQATLRREHIYRDWYVDAIYRDLENFALHLRYQERLLFYHTWQKISLEIASYWQSPIIFSMQGEYTLDDDRFGISFGIEFLDV